MPGWRFGDNRSSRSAGVFITGWLQSRITGWLQSRPVLTVVVALSTYEELLHRAQRGAAAQRIPPSWSPLRSSMHRRVWSRRTRRERAAGRRVWPPWPNQEARSSRASRGSVARPRSRCDGAESRPYRTGRPPGRTLATRSVVVPVRTLLALAGAAAQLMAGATGATRR